MARFSRLDVLNTMIDTGMVPLFFKEDLEVAKKILSACAQGGARVIEFTNRGDMAPFVFAELVQYTTKELPHVQLGAGTIVDPHTAAHYIAYGANFIVGPNLNREVALLCNRRKIPYFPGCATATEISEAEALGVEIVKLFPSTSIDGPKFVKAILEPCPWTRIMPTGGIQATEEGIATWFRAGVSCIGMGSGLLRENFIAADNFDEIASLTRNVLAWIRKVRSEM
jgi:2-dehydro-3-deoxyphosphogluconate aldolase/(4S)-4-hydroxy-2-oxoglutarate aldolase